MDKKRELNPREYDDLMKSIMESLFHNGFKATTMDSIAASRQMSKRTLYEIFTSKENMIWEAHRYFHKRIYEELKQIFNTSENVMEAIIRCFLYNRDLMSKVSADFMRGINQNHLNDHHYTKKEFIRQHDMYLYDVLKRGVEEGYFIDDINLMVQCRMLGIQMESLKRMEELFPKDISLLEVFDSITLGFLRGICTEKGRKELDRVMPLLKLKYNTENNI